MAGLDFFCPMRYTSKYIRRISKPLDLIRVEALEQAKKDYMKQMSAPNQYVGNLIGSPINPSTYYTNFGAAQQSLPFSNGQASSMASKLIQQIKAEVIQYLAPKILNYLARNLACSCSDHTDDCPWGGNLKEIRSRLEDSMCAMELEDKLTL